MIAEKRLSAVFTTDEGEHIEIPVIAWNGLWAMVATRKDDLVRANAQPNFLGFWNHAVDCTGGQYDKGFTKHFGVKGVFKGTAGFMRVVSCLP